MTAVQPIAGPAGTNGNGALGVDVWASQGNPAAVTDWGPIINTLISAGNRRLLFSQHDFPFSTKIDLGTPSTVSNGIVFEGIGAGQGWQQFQGTKARLIWKSGAGSGNAITCHGGDAPTFQHLGIIYDNNAYNGDLIDGNCSGLRMLNCSLGANSVNQQTARSILKLDGIVGGAFKDCTIFGALTPIRGHETGSGVCNQVVFEDCMFTGFATAAVANAGNGWFFRACTWQFDFAPVNAQGFITDVTPNDTASVVCSNGCTFWDYSQSGQGIIKTLAAHTNKFLFTMKDCGVGNGGNMSFLAPGEVVLDNVVGFQNVPYPAAPYIDMGTSGGGSAKDKIVVRNCTFPDSNGTGDVTRLIANLDGGHAYIDVTCGNYAQNTTKQMRTEGGYKRLPVPADGAKAVFTKDAGQTGLTIPNVGQSTDSQGIIELSGNANSGILGTVTFPATLIGFPGSSGGNRLHITLSPYSGYKGDAASAGAFYDAKIYAEVIGDTNLTGFKIMCAVGWTSKNVQIAYQVSVQG